MVNLFSLAFLYQNNQHKVLLIRRKNLKFGAGLYGLVGGSVEQGETALHAIAREVQEEIGLNLAQDAFELVHTLHRKGTEAELVCLVFRCNITGLEPRNMEPNKHDDMQWFSIDQLPQNIILAHKQAIESIVSGVSYSEHGWQ